VASQGYVPLPRVSDSAVVALAEYGQGEIVELRMLPIISPWPPNAGRTRLSFREVLTARFGHGRATHIGYPAPYGCVVVSQTCDIVQSDRLTVQLAPLASLGEADAREAEIYRRPRYIPLPNADDGLFVDLQGVSTVHKDDLVGIAHRPGVNNIEEGRKLAQAIGRRFTRFAFPDELHPWLRPLENLLQTKAAKVSSPEGQALASVVEIRVEAKDGWKETGPYVLTIIIILESGALPYGQYDEAPIQPDGIGAWLRDSNGVLKRTSSAIAAKLNTAADAPERYYLWLALGEAWAAQCHPGGNVEEAVEKAVNSIDGEVVTAYDLTMDRWWRSEALDLDYLSPPRPR
jgi:hypothetical protein